MYFHHSRWGTMRFINYVLYGAILGLIFLALGISGLMSANIIANPLPSNFKDYIPKAYIVQSGSMAPAIKVGSIVIAQKSLNYLPNEVITFKNTAYDKNPTTHRIQFKNYPEGVNNPPEYLTAGDANEEFDRNSVKDGQIVGKVVFTLPYAGYIASFAKDPRGFILMVVVPATIIIYEELKFLKREFGKSYSKFRQKVKYRDPKKEEKPLPRISILIPAIGAAVVIFSISLAYFLDSEDSIGNIFGAASSFSTPAPSVSPSPSPTPIPTPTPGIAQTLVINEFFPDTSCFQGQTEAQWIELYNGYSVTVNLKNFKITDGTNTIDLVNSNTDLPAGQFALLAHSNSIWNSCYSHNGAITVNLGGQLNIDVGQIQIIDTDGLTVIDTVIWGTNSLTPAQNESIERVPDGWDSATGTGFVESDFVEKT